MKKIWIVVLLIPFISTFLYIAVDQYTKYALKVAMIKLIKEYCDEEIEVTRVQIYRINTMGNNMHWSVHTEPTKYSLGGRIDVRGYHTYSPGVCSEGPLIPLRLNRFTREFVQNTRAL